MLAELHVKNLALIEKADVEFGEGLNILTGETGAGKSIIIGSVNIALGGKIPKDIIRSGADYAYIELIFFVTEKEKLDALKELDMTPAEDGMLIISKKIMPSRSISKINDETVTAAKLRQITNLLIDIHGQHDHQSLLYKSKHLEILDEYVKNDTQELKQNISQMYHAYNSLKERLNGFSADNESRFREVDFLRFEIDEIENAELCEGEEEELTAEHRRYANMQKIAESLSTAYDIINSDQIGKAFKAVSDIEKYDERLKTVAEQLCDADSILSDAGHEISSYIGELTFDAGRLNEIEARLDLIHTMHMKYGNTVEQILGQLEDKKKKLEELVNFDEIRQKTEKELSEVTDKLEQLCTNLSQIRKNAADRLTEKIRSGLTDLNFIDIEFAMNMIKLDTFTANGCDEAEFVISTNPGEAKKPLGQVASGGELSRIMLAIKTVLADTDDIPTLIFDEIDTGISGRTAQKVSEKLKYIAKGHQVICITHLPQIAAMADSHFEIAKSAKEGKTTTSIHTLDENQMITELARLLGGAEITEAVLQNAREMKELAKRTK